MLGEQLERLVSVGSLEDGVPSVAEHPADPTAHALIVFRHDNGFIPARLGVAGATLLTGYRCGSHLGQLDDEGGAAAELTLHPDEPAVLGHRPQDAGKAQ